LSTTITFTPTPDELRRRAKTRSKLANLAHPDVLKRYVFLLLFDIVVVGGAVFALSHNRTTIGIELLGIAGLVPYITLLNALARHILLNRQIRDVEERTCVIDDDGISLQTSSTEIRENWPAIENIVRGDNFIAITAKGARVLHLPERCIEPRDPAAFIHYLEQLKADFRAGTTPPSEIQYSVTFPNSPNLFVQSTAILSSTPGTSARRLTWSGLIGAIIWWGVYESIEMFQSNGPGPWNWIFPLCVLAAIYVAFAVAYLRYPKQTTIQSAPTIPWNTVSGLLKVSLLQTGVITSWDYGSSKIEWDIVSNIELQNNDIVFFGKGIVHTAIPNSAFLSKEDRDAFLNAAEQYRRGETPPPITQAWPPPVLL